MTTKTPLHSTRAHTCFSVDRLRKMVCLLTCLSTTLITQSTNVKILPYLNCVRTRNTCGAHIFWLMAFFYPITSIWTPSLWHQVTWARLPLTYGFLWTASRMPTKKSQFPFNIIKSGMDVQLTRSPKGSTCRKVLKNNYLHQQYINYCPESNSIKPLYTI